MWVHPNFDPVAVSLGPLAIRWYGLMYLCAFAGFLLLGRYRIRTQAHVRSAGWTAELVDDLLFYGVVGVIVGGRLGYVLFYKPAYYLAHLSEIPAVWQGGMAFHGGFLGVLAAMWWVGRKHGKAWLDVIDFIAPLVPLGLAFGRLGNFINGELWGRVTDVGAPWATIFPQAPDRLPRHPSQLYQFALEGLALFVLLWWFAAQPRRRGAVAGVFLVGYGLCRFAVEFAREPDSFLGLLSFNLSMGQWLSIPMLAAGAFLLVYSGREVRKA